MPKGKKKKKVVAKKVEIPPDNKLPALFAADPRTTALLHTVTAGDVRSFDRLVNHYDYRQILSTVDVNGSTPIHIAARKNDPTTLGAILRYETIDINARELRIIGGQAAIHHACSGGPPLFRVLELLLVHGANANIKSESTIGETPLHICCKYGFAESARLLMKHGAVGTILDNFGNNAAFWAYQNRQEHMSRELDLPPQKTATAEDMLAMIKLNNPNFKFPALKKGGKKKGAGKKEPGKKKK